MTGSLTPSGLSNTAIAGYAERVGEHHGIYSQQGKADLDKLLGVLGGRVEVSPAVFAPEALTVFDRGHFTVHLPPITSDRRDRFTIAHEIGHYFLHYLLPQETQSKVFGRGSQNRAETEANVFAASLLMPTNEFRAAYEHHGADWWKLGDTFGVSPQAATVRAQVLGLHG